MKDNFIKINLLGGPLFVVCSLDDAGEVHEHIATFYNPDELNDFLAYKESIGQRCSCVRFREMYAEVEKC